MARALCGAPAAACASHDGSSSHHALPSIAQRNAFMFADAAQQDQPSDEEIRATGADAPDSLAYKVG